MANAHPSSSYRRGSLSHAALSDVLLGMMHRAGFLPEDTPAMTEELRALSSGLPASCHGSDLRDMRSLLWSSIDNAESRDLDQIEYVEVCGAKETATTGAVWRVLVGIADVDCFVCKNSALDAHAAANTTSVYTGGHVFPMLPPVLSFDKTSLNEGVERCALVVEMHVGRDGSVKSCDVYRALVINHAKLAYETIGPWLEGSAAEPDKVRRYSGGLLRDQLWLQDRVSSALKSLRVAHGALEFETTEARMSVSSSPASSSRGRSSTSSSPSASNVTMSSSSTSTSSSSSSSSSSLSSLSASASSMPSLSSPAPMSVTLTKKDRSKSLIEDFMVAANICIARYLSSKGRTSLRRVVKEPARWPRIVEIAAEFGAVLPAHPNAIALAEFLGKRRALDPLRYGDLSLAIIKCLGPGEYRMVPASAASTGEDAGHFGLATDSYSHATAPNRRYTDLITQRLIKSAILSSLPPYSDAELDAIAKRCTLMEREASKIERTSRKSAAAIMLADWIGCTFEAVVTGVKGRNVYCRLLSPPIEGSIVSHSEGMDVGMRVRVKLLSTDAAKGFIDFEGLALSA
jgi:exoribonuclease R